MLRIVFMGTPPFAVRSLERLIESSHPVVAVVTQPDSQVGRGRHFQTPPVKEVALANDIPVLQPARIRGNVEFMDSLRSLHPDVIVVAAYGKILPPEVLDLPPHGCINVHASLLPDLRGAAPVNWAIARGYLKTGVTIMQMNAGMDTGGIIEQEEVEILDDDDAESLTNMLSVIGAEALLRVIDRLDADRALSTRPQDEDEATYAPMLKKIDGAIDWSRSTEEIICLIRGMAPWPGAYTASPKGTLKILDAEPYGEDRAESIADAGRISPGSVAATPRKLGFVVRTGSDFLLVRKAQPQGRNPMSAVDILNGNYIKTGDKLLD